MLPKVATHLGRAIAAAHSQTTQAVRNVLQLQSSSTPGGWSGASSSSGWGSYGAGSGGAKFHAGSRFQSGYTGPGRAVTQAEQAANDAADDDDVRGRRRSLGRRKSLSFIQHDSVGETLGVLRAVKLHARPFHALTAAVTAEDFAPPPPAPSQAAGAIEENQNAEQEGKVSKVALYNETLYTLTQSRKPGESLELVLETYNEMLSRSVLPNFRTYTIMIQALAERDFEVQRHLMHLDRNVAQGESLLGAAVSGMRDEAAKLRAENNFGSAFSLFQACCALPRVRLPMRVYNLLLRSCAMNKNVDAAIYVFAHLERRGDILPTTETFKHLVSVYARAADVAGVREVFEGYREACREGRIQWADQFVEEDRVAHLILYNTVIEAYIRAGQPTTGIALLEQMLDSKAGEAFGPQDIPNPASMTFARIIRAFCDAGEVHDALAWFERLLQQPTSATSSSDLSATPTRPNKEAWATMLPALAAAGMMPEFNRLFARMKELAKQDDLPIRRVDMSYYISGNIRYLRTHPELDDATAISQLDSMLDNVYYSENPLPYYPSQFVGGSEETLWEAVVDLYLSRGQVEKALVFHERMTALEYSKIRDREQSEFSDPDALAGLAYTVRRHVENSSKRFLTEQATSISLKQLLRLAETNQSIGITLSSLHPYYMEKYTDEQTRGSLSELTFNEWTVLLHACLIQYRSGFQDVRVPIENIIAEAGKYCPERLQMLSMALASEIVQAIVSHSGPEAARAMIATHKPHWLEHFPQMANAGHRVDPGAPYIPTPSAATDAPLPVDAAELPGRIFIDSALSKLVEQFAGNHPKITPLVAFERIELALRESRYPRPSTIAQLIGALGRAGDIERIRWLYNLAQTVLANMEKAKMWQSVSWFQVEDQMALALAHCGDIEGAHVHRLRILEQGGVPSADTYGALIHNVQDTTDDATNAMALFQESQARGVLPNIYLYNTIISKLAKARKADYALSLFSDMKSRHLHPTSVTYGALIAACCRVGDAASAENLFDEMVSQKNFKPRVPPYNTMMQLYTHTKPDRQRVLYYYNSMLAAKVQPTAHTYKLLIDAYGCIEPFDVPAMEQVFASLVSGDRPMVQGTHWAAMINAYGCVQKNLEKSLDLFNSIASHPSTQRINASLPDAVVFEALINVLVTLRRSDLIPAYTEKLGSYGVHMTAYIANLLIKGYAAAGDIQHAREIFEGLADPPEGVAAPHNHAPHADDVAHTAQVPVHAPVYREPSTWEAMVRAELGIGNRDGAVALLQRVQTRKFPPAVYNRISGIMLDDSVSPWPSPDPTQSPSSWGVTESTSQSTPSP